MEQECKQRIDKGAIKGKKKADWRAAEERKKKVMALIQKGSIVGIDVCITVYSVSLEDFVFKTLFF